MQFVDDFAWSTICCFLLDCEQKIMIQFCYKPINANYTYNDDF